MEPALIRTQGMGRFRLKMFLWYLVAYGLALGVVRHVFGDPWAVGELVLESITWSGCMTLILGSMYLARSRKLGALGPLSSNQAAWFVVGGSSRDAIELCGEAMARIGARDVKVHLVDPPVVTGRMPLSRRSSGEKLQAAIEATDSDTVRLEIGSRSRWWGADYFRNVENVNAILSKLAELSSQAPRN